MTSPDTNGTWSRAPGRASAFVDAQPVLVNASRFRAAHVEEWERLDRMVTRMEKRSVRALADDDLLAMPSLYRSALSSLSVARETSLDRAPKEADDVTRAVPAAALLRDRRLALTRLQHLGVHVIESDYDRVGEQLVAGYVDLKRRNLL